jgi:hypothetical protein
MAGIALGEDCRADGKLQTASGLSGKHLVVGANSSAKQCGYGLKNRVHTSVDAARTSAYATIDELCTRLKLALMGPPDPPPGYWLVLKWSAVSEP